MTEIKRKGSRSAEAISTALMEQLNRGEMETANLVEWLAVDQKLLLENLLRQTRRLYYLEPILAVLEALPKQTVNILNEAIGTTMHNLAEINNDQEFLLIISNHTADLVRCWAAYTVGKNQRLSLDAMLQKIQPFAGDAHFGVREISWMAVRPAISKHLAESLNILSGWAKHDNENIRRFASEATRPRGVWCANIEALKKNPESGLVILELLKSDASKYVLDSVGNWLNDASKTKQEFVKELCKKWENESPTKETAYIIKKALRTIEK